VSDYAGVRYAQIIFNYARQILRNWCEDDDLLFPADGPHPQATALGHAHVPLQYLRESAATLMRFGVVPSNIQIVNLL
jgi:hypothetical protein